MYFEAADRLVRQRWSQDVTAYLAVARRLGLDEQSATRALELAGNSLDSFAFELANVLRARHELRHRGKLNLELALNDNSDDAVLEVRNWGHPDGYAAKFYGEVLFVPPLNLAGAGTMNWAKATANWTKQTGTNNHYVDCTMVDGREDFTGDNGPIRVYLPSGLQRDPNVRIGQIIAYVLDTNGEAIAVGDYGDDPVGTIKAWHRLDMVPGGWNVVMPGRVIFGHSDSDEIFSSIWSMGGAKVHSHDDHEASDIDPHSDYVTGTAGGDAWELTLSFGEVEIEVEILESTPEHFTTSPGAIVTTTDKVEFEPHLEGDGLVDSELVHKTEPDLPPSFSGHDHDPAPPGPAGLVLPGVADLPQDIIPQETGITLNGGEDFRVQWDRAEIVDPDFVQVLWSHTHDVSVEAIIYEDPEADPLVERLVPVPHIHLAEASAHSHADVELSGNMPIHDHGIPDLTHSGDLEHTPADHMPPYQVEQWIHRYE